MVLERDGPVMNAYKYACAHFRNYDASRCRFRLHDWRFGLLSVTLYSSHGARLHRTRVRRPLLSGIFLVAPCAHIPFGVRSSRFGPP